MSDPTVSDRRAEWTWSVPIGVMQVAGLSSIGAGAIHAAVSGVHAGQVTLTRLFVAAAVAQIAAGLTALVRGGWLAATATFGVNVAAVAVWVASRQWGVSWISGLEEPEAIGFADATCAALAAVAAIAVAVALVRQRVAVGAVRLGLPATAVGVLTGAAMLVGVTSHSHATADHAHGDEQTAVTAEVDGHAHDGAAEVAADSGTADGGVASAGLASPAAWPRPWDPAVGIDFSDTGATRAQQLRAAGLINATQRDLPRFADPTVAYSLGYRSIGDADTGFEHYLNTALIADETWLDPKQPESLVYRVDGDERTLVSAMFIVPDREVDDPEIAEYGGPLMQWHVHRNLCWGLDDGTPKVVAIADDDGTCPPPSVLAGGEHPMVHVWIAPHECGPFAALEGHGAGQVDSEAPRIDQCAHGHEGDGAAAAEAGADAAGGHDHPQSGAGVAAPAEQTATPRAYDPALPIDLSGTPGVSLEQQAFAENVIADTIRNLPQWADPEVAEAAGFHSIGDAATGHEHFINWEWINDDVFLDPDRPESLVYEPQPDGSRKLVSAMYMLPDSYDLTDVPDWGGALMQWHIHDNLCFTADEEAPRVGGLTDAAGTCTAPLVKLTQSPMIHVWITPHACGPFAALEGVGAGQVAAGETHRCDELHGDH